MSLISGIRIFPCSFLVHKFCVCPITKVLLLDSHGCARLEVVSS